MVGWSDLGGTPAWRACTAVLRGCTRLDETAVPLSDLVERNFNPTASDRLYTALSPTPCTSEGWRYLAVVLDCSGRRVVGGSIAHRVRSSLPREIGVALRRDH